jgi:hypothetical protein
MRHGVPMLGEFWRNLSQSVAQLRHVVVSGVRRIGYDTFFHKGLQTNGESVEK